MSDANETEFDPLVDKAPARYVVGIDLGTTNSAVTYIDTNESPWQIRNLEIPQVTASGQIENVDTLPSFHFQVLPQEAEAGAVRLPWHESDQDWCVGTMARDAGVKSPGRLCASAKSWLCHSGVDREAKLLPWQPATGVDRLSPVEVSGRLLAHIRDAWNQRFPKEGLADQDVVITLPASFDEVARELTVRAAAEAGLPNVVLIEEPQAAFYAWVYKHDSNWFEQVEAGHTILVCDIGGGTSDFTLIKVRRSETSPEDQSGESQTPTAEKKKDRVQFHRVAVGEHLILGGDNLDLALAHYLENRITDGGKLTPKQWDVLVRSCRRVKEQLSSSDAPDETTVNLPGSGAKLVGGGLQAKVTRDEVESLLLDGFLPKSKLIEKPARGQSGFREFGLPFASDPAITKHLASFLTSHGDDQSSSARPDVILFNGGFFASRVLQQRLLEVVHSWFSESDSGYDPDVLDNDRLDLAVARGAAYYGMVRRGEGVRIAANLARSYYVEVDTDAETSQAVCLVPGDTEPGQEIHLDSLKLELAIAQPVEFSLFTSSVRLTDGPGELVTIDPEQMKALPPIRTVLRTERRNQTGTLPVTLNAHLSEIGTIDLWCQAVETDHRWRLQFDVRSTTQTDVEAHVSEAESEGFVDESTWQACEQVIDDVFAETGDEKPSRLVKQLARVLDSGKLDWPTSLLRRIWEKLLDSKEGRRRSPAHEARWLNLVGFALRPGYGLAVDDWRVAETWRHVNGKLIHGGASKSESLILWRRIAGGLSPGQQSAIAQPMLASLRASHSILIEGKQSRGEPMYPMHESDEAWRLLGSLEHLDADVKIDTAKMLIALLPKRRYERVRAAMLWCLGRLGQRQPLYGPLNSVVSASEAAGWCKRTIEFGSKHTDHRGTCHLAIMQMARRTSDRYRDFDSAESSSILEWLKETNAPERYSELVERGGDLQAGEQASVFGEALPKGFRLRA
ncbi:MAG: Hsp70 family protein [Planctomycetota bacterium]